VRVSVKAFHGLLTLANPNRRSERSVLNSLPGSRQAEWLVRGDDLILCIRQRRTSKHLNLSRCLGGKVHFVRQIHLLRQGLGHRSACRNVAAIAPNTLGRSGWGLVRVGETRESCLSRAGRACQVLPSLRKMDFDFSPSITSRVRDRKTRPLGSRARPRNHRSRSFKSDFSKQSRWGWLEVFELFRGFGP